MSSCERWAPAELRGAPRAPCRQTPGRRCSGPRLAESGSSPVSTLNATGICRRRLTPSFVRSVSECAFAVRGEMPSRSPTSSFEHPAAISATTSRCLGVRPVPLWVVVVIMASEASSRPSGHPFVRRCNPGCNFRDAAAASCMRLSRAAAPLSARMRPGVEFRRGCAPMTDLVHDSDMAVDVILRDGATLRLRAPVDGDVPALARLLRGTSRSGAAFSASTGSPSRATGSLRTLVDPDWAEKGALIGVMGDDGEERIVAVGNYVRLRDPHTAEAAFAVADDYQAQGDRHAAPRAARDRAPRRTASRRSSPRCSPENRAMLSVFENVGFVPDAHARRRRRRGAGSRSPRPTATRRASTSATTSPSPPRCARSSSPARWPSSAPRPAAGSIGGLSSATSSTGGFTGAAYPVNRSGEPVAGVRAYRSIEEIADPIDLCVICLPGEHVIDAAEAALRAGTRALCVISAGFAETGPEGIERQEQLLALVRAHGARLVGPNCLGIATASVGMNATFAPRAFPAGPDRLLLAVGSARPRAARARRGARPRAVGVRLDRQQGGRLLQRPARVVGGRPGHRPRPALPRVVRQPAQVRAASPGGWPARSRCWR